MISPSARPIIHLRILPILSIAVQNLDYDNDHDNESGFASRYLRQSPLCVLSWLIPLRRISHPHHFAFFPPPLSPHLPNDVAVRPQ